MVKLEPELKQRLKVEAARRGTDMSKLTREALSEYLERLPSAPAHARRFARRSDVERILREAPLDPEFARDVKRAAGQTIDEL